MVCCAVGCCPSVPKRRVCEGTVDAAIPVKKETAECRLCYEHGETNALIAPCKCSGHMKYVHRDCLDVWRAHNQHCEHFFRCDICGLPYVLEQHSAEGEQKGMSPKAKYGWLVFGDVMAALAAVQAVIFLTSFIINWGQKGSFGEAGKTFFSNGEEFWLRYLYAFLTLLCLFGTFTCIMQCINCCCPKCFTGTCWRGELMSNWWWSCGCCNSRHHQSESREDNYVHHSPSRSGCSDGGCICISSGGGDCNSGGGGGGNDSCEALIAIIIIVLIVIGFIQLIIFSVIVVQLIVRRHIHVLEKRYLASIWRVRDRDGEDLSNQVVHVQWYNIVQPEQEAAGAPAVPSFDPAVPSAPPAPCGGLYPIPECHLTMGPTPPQGYDTLVQQVKTLGW